MVAKSTMLSASLRMEAESQVRGESRSIPFPTAPLSTEEGDSWKRRSGILDFLEAGGSMQPYVGIVVEAPAVAEDLNLLDDVSKGENANPTAFSINGHSGIKDTTPHGLPWYQFRSVHVAS
jgi:hypothetical protein